MRRLGLFVLVASGIIGSARDAQAVPVLQLDIVGGRYDAATETIISDGPQFTLIALLTPKSADDLTSLYYISAALTPQTPLTNPAPSLGSFTFGEATVQVTSGMNWGVPPVESADIEQPHDGGDLGRHSIYPTYFYETPGGFTFGSAAQSATYNTALNPGGPTAGTGSYYVAFNVDATNLQSGYSLHFDMYDTYFKTQCSGPNRTRVCGTDEDIDHFAPFSHDAGIGASMPPPPAPVPEPGTLVLLGTGLAFTVRRVMRRTQQ